MDARRGRMEGNDDICGKQNSEALSEIEVRKSLDSAADRLCDRAPIRQNGQKLVCARGQAPDLHLLYPPCNQRAFPLPEVECVIIRLLVGFPDAHDWERRLEQLHGGMQYRAQILNLLRG